MDSLKTTNVVVLQSAKLKKLVVTVTDKGNVAPVGCRKPFINSALLNAYDKKYLSEWNRRKFVSNKRD
jgi:hypothetical protein